MSQKIEAALKKLDSFLKENKDDSMVNPIVEYLKKRVEDSESLAEDICQDVKTWTKCRAYITEQARELLNGKSGAIEDKQVYEWTEDYFHNKLKSDSEKDDPKDKKEKKKEKKSELPEPIVDKPVEKPKAKAKEKGKEKPAEKPAKKKDELEGQMDIFSFLQ